MPILVYSSTIDNTGRTCKRILVCWDIAAFTKSEPSLLGGISEMTTPYGQMDGLTTNSGDAPAPWLHSGLSAWPVE